MAPNMFSRRRAASNPAINQNPNPTPSAALAATQAFLKDRQSNASLSSAAAAAALKTHPTPPTPVAEIQTKRMVRRGSNSSAGSAPEVARNGGDRGLRRQNSSGSMTERTFRSTSPSPNRNSMSHVAADPHAPPVPAIPRRISRSPDSSRARSSSLEPQGRISSPAPQTPGGRGASVDTATRRPSQRTSTRGAPTTAAPAAASAPAPAAEPTASPRSSINFSRPYSPSPPTSPAVSGKGWHTSPVVSNARARAGSTPSQRSKLSETSHPIERQAVSPVDTSPGGLQSSKHAGSNEQLPSSPATKADRIINAAQHYGPQHTVLHKKPSVIQEEPQEGQKPAVPASPTREMNTSQWAPRRAATVSTPNKATAEKARERAATQPVASQDSGAMQSLNPADAEDLQNRSRQSSVSPSRSAHFSANPPEMLAGIKHQPLPRSISPAKSALKHSASVRNASPSVSIASRQGGSTISETSDNVSDDGSKAAKRKKSVRVSFDAEPVVAGYAVGPVTPISPATGFPSETAGDDDDDVLKPTPALPSFGSIRSSPRRNQDSDVPEKVTEKVTETVSSTKTARILGEKESSHDQAVGAIVAQDFASKQPTQPVDPNEPLPPEVTSVEGSGYISDPSIGSDSEDDAPAPPSVPSTQDTSDKTDSSTAPSKDLEPSDNQASPEAVPAIAVQPATPAAVDDPRKSAEYIIPGGFPVDFSPPEPKSAPSVKQDMNSAAVPKQAQDESEATNPPPRTSLTTEALAELIPDDTSSSSDNESIYSDAEENVEDYDRSGFASLDAIVESPMQPALASRLVEPPSDERANTLHALEVSQLSDSTAVEEQEQEQTLTAAEAKGPEMSRPHTLPEPRVNKPAAPTVSTTVETIDESAPAAAPKPKSKKKKKKVASPVAQPTSQQPESPTAFSSAYPPLKPSTQAKKNLAKQAQGSPTTPAKASNVPEVQMRKSMRPKSAQPSTGGGLHSSKYSQPVEPRGTLQKKHIPPTTTQPRAAVAARTAAVPPSSTPSQTSAVAIAKATYPRTLGMSHQNNSDDSVSSFRRSRRVSDFGGGRMTMRTTMRQGPQGPARPMSAGGPAPKSSRFSVRSSSPTGSVLSDSRVKPMRTSLRGSVDMSSNLHGPSSPGKSKPSRSFFGRDKGRAAAPAPASGPRFTSRFADSSDEEDEERPSLPAFRSRFADSDDEDDTKLTPVRGIPRRAGAEDGDSTDLEDSDDEAGRSSSAARSKKKGKAAPPVAAAGAAINGKTNGVASSKHADLSGPGVITSVSGPENQKKRRSFFGFGKKKDALPIMTQVPPATEGTQSPTASTSPTSPTRNPKLQRRSLPQPRPQADTNWPLPSVREAEELERPRTADGVTSKMSRPTLGDRMDSAPPVPALPSGYVDGTATVGHGGIGDIRGRSGKKKRFPGLRKVFRLND